MASRWGAPHSISAAAIASSSASGPGGGPGDLGEDGGGTAPGPGSPTAIRSSASGSAATSRARRRRAARSSSASGATNPAAGSARATTTASRPGTDGEANAARSVPHRAPTPFPARTSATGTRRWSPARSRRSGSRSQSAADLSERARPPVIAASALLVRRPRSSPRLPASSQRAAAAKSTAKPTRAGAFIPVGRGWAGSRLVDSREPVPDRGEAHELESRRGAGGVGGAGLDRSVETKPGSTSSAKQGGSGGHGDDEHPRETRLRGGGSRVGGHSIALGGGTAKRLSRPARSPPLSCWERSAVANESTRGDRRRT